MNPSYPSRSLTSIIAVICCLFTSCEEETPKRQGFDAKQAELGVVRVIVAIKNSQSIGYSSGSGFYIGDNTLITNNHVIADASSGKLVVARKDGPTAIEIRDATVFWTDKELDIAILKVPDIGCEELTLSEAPVEKGSRAFAIGFPTSADASRRSGSGQMGPSEKEFINLAFSSNRGVIDNANIGLVQFLDPTVTSGEIRKTLTRKWQPEYNTELEVLDHDVNIGHGNSGGPLFDECGRVIGINTQGLDAQTIKTLKLADIVKNSSRITELISVLEKQNIAATVTSEPCIIETAAEGLNWKIWALLGVVAAAAVASLLITMLKKPATESYTQYLGRVSGMSRINRRPASSGPAWDGGQIVDAAPSQPVSPPVTPPANPQASPPPTATGVWSLQGNNPEAGKSPSIHFQLTADLFQRYGGHVTIGRKPGVAHLVIDNTSISKAHAIVSLNNGSLTVRDNSSSNGTSLNGTRLAIGQQLTLNPGDQLQLGEVTLSFSKIS